MLDPANSSSQHSPTSSFPPVKSRIVLRGVFIFVIYLLAFLLLDIRARTFQILPGVVAWYPPDGLSLAFLLTFGTIFLPGLALTSILSSLFIFHLSLPLTDLLTWAILLSLAYGGVVWFLKRHVQMDTQLHNPRDLFWLVASTSIAAAVLAVLSVSASTASGNIAATEQLWATVQWWIGEMIGILVIVPALLIHAMPYLKRFAQGEEIRRGKSLPRLSRSVIAQMMSLAVTFYLIFDVHWSNNLHPYFLIATPLIWIAIEHGISGVSLGILVVNFAMVRGVQWHEFIPAELGQLQLLMFVINLACLFIGIIVSERQQPLKSMNAEIARKRNKIMVELILISILAMATWILEYTFDFLETVAAWEERHNIRGVDEALVTISVLGVAWAFFSYRRWKELETETRVREKAQAELHTLYRELEERVQQRTADLSSANAALQREITERKQAETALKQAESKYRILVEQLPAVTYIVQYGEVTDPIYVSPQIESIFGFTAEEWLANPNLWIEHIHPDDRDKVLGEFARLDRLGLPIDLDYRIVTRDGRTCWVHDQSVLIPDETGKPRYGHGLLFDITQRKQTEEALAHSERRLRALIENSLEEISLVTPEGKLLYESPTRQRPLGYPPGSFLGLNLFDLFHPDDREAAREILNEISREPGGYREAFFRIRHQNGSWRWLEGNVHNLLDEPAIQAIVINYRDITERKLAAEEIQSRNEELSTLYELSRALAEANDVETVLDLVSRRTVESLHTTFARIILQEGDELVTRSVHPVRVLDYDLDADRRSPISKMPSSQQVIARGEPVILLRSTAPVGDEERAVLLLDLAQTLCLVPLRVHDFRANTSATLGLLTIGEVRNEKREPFTEEKLRLARSIGDQAAIAIENTRLFNDLQRSNLELVHAYDATILGWSAALDLRDKETEGHTQRVTEMTIRLAKEMGFSEQEMIHIRRGALLHDIGKMGVPDRILFKPGKLTDEEWAIMRMHPPYAFQMLKPITYLRLALDIPYCHHEKWDGTGYPRGLRGEQIPLQARIFAIADVYDALTSDRPYRSAWSQEETLQYIQGLSGSHFDPNVVDVFLNMFHQKTETWPLTG